MWISLYHANSADPGFLPRNVPEYDMAIKQVPVKNTPPNKLDPVRDA